MVKRFGIIGLGKFGEKYVKTLQSFPDVELVIACRKTNERPNFLPVNCQFTTNYEEILDQCLDGIIVATDPNNHYEIAVKRLLDEGAILLEKPACLTLNQAEHLQKLSNYSFPCLVDYIHLFAPAFIELQNKIIDHKLKITSINSESYNNGPIRNFPTLFDYLPHELSMGISLFKSSPKIEYAQKRFNTNDKNRALYDLILDYNGIKHNIRIGNGAEEKRQQFEVGIENEEIKGNIIYSNNSLKYNYTNVVNLPIIRTQSFDNPTPLHNTIQCFIDLIDGKQNKRADFNLTIEITKIIEKIYQMVA